MTTTLDARYRAKTLQAALDEQGLRRDWVATNAGISPSLLTRIIKGERTASREVADRLAAILRTPFFVLWESTDQIISDTGQDRIA